MSLTILTRDPPGAVRIGGEHDEGGKRGRVLLVVAPQPHLLMPATARKVARALMRFADRARK